jgi:hypothetical protein
MKVVINRRYGGFGLSDKAVEACIALGMTVAADIETSNGFDFLRADFVSEDYYCLRGDDKAFRCDPRLVQVVEQLGRAAHGSYSHLKVVEIPFDTTEGWKITDWEGWERIDEEHRSWS